MHCLLLLESPYTLALHWTTCGVLASLFKRLSSVSAFLAASTVTMTAFWDFYPKSFFQQISFLGKVENILKGSLDSISSPSLKIQIMGGKVCWRCKGITGCCQQTFECKKFVDNAQQCFAFTYQANFPIHNLNFHQR